MSARPTTQSEIPVPDPEDAARRWRWLAWLWLAVSPPGLFLVLRDRAYLGRDPWWSGIGYVRLEQWVGLLLVAAHLWLIGRALGRTRPVGTEGPPLSAPVPDPE